MLFLGMITTLAFSHFRVGLYVTVAHLWDDDHAADAFLGIGSFIALFFISLCRTPPRAGFNFFILNGRFQFLSRFCERAYPIPHSSKYCPTHSHVLYIYTTYQNIYFGGSRGLHPDPLLDESIPLSNGLDI
jgi:hypothetical protein